MDSSTIFIESYLFLSKLYLFLLLLSLFLELLFFETQEPIINYKIITKLIIQVFNK